jgi:hypothetical protein
MNVKVTLNTGLGVDMGPNYVLTTDIGEVLPSHVTQTQLLAGVTVSIDDNASFVKVTSLGNCTNSLNITITGKTAIVYSQSNVEYPNGWATSNEACAPSGVTNTVYYTGTLKDGTVLYSNPELTINFNDSGSIGWYRVNGYVFTYPSTTNAITNYTKC